MKPPWGSTLAKAIVVEEDPNKRLLVMRDIPNLEAGPRQVKIRVRAASVNPAGIAQRAGVGDSQPENCVIIAGLPGTGDVSDQSFEDIRARS